MEEYKKDCIGSRFANDKGGRASVFMIVGVVALAFMLVSAPVSDGLVGILTVAIIGGVIAGYAISKYFNSGKEEVDTDASIMLIGEASAISQNSWVNMSGALAENAASSFGNTAGGMVNVFNSTDLLYGRLGQSMVISEDMINEDKWGASWDTENKFVVSPMMNDLRDVVYGPRARFTGSLLQLKTDAMGVNDLNDLGELDIRQGFAMAEVGGSTVIHSDFDIYKTPIAIGHRAILNEWFYGSTISYITPGASTNNTLKFSGLYLESTGPEYILPGDTGPIYKEMNTIDTAEPAVGKMYYNVSYETSDQGLLKINLPYLGWWQINFHTPTVNYALVVEDGVPFDVNDYDLAIWTCSDSKVAHLNHFRSWYSNGTAFNNVPIGTTVATQEFSESAVIANNRGYVIATSRAYKESLESYASVSEIPDDFVLPYVDIALPSADVVADMDYREVFVLNNAYLDALGKSITSTLSVLNQSDIPLPDFDLIINGTLYHNVKSGSWTNTTVESGQWWIGPTTRDLHLKVGENTTADQFIMAYFLGNGSNTSAPVFKYIPIYGSSNTSNEYVFHTDAILKDGVPLSELLLEVSSVEDFMLTAFVSGGVPESVKLLVINWGWFSDNWLTTSGIIISILCLIGFAGGFFIDRKTWALLFGCAVLFSVGSYYYFDAWADGYVSGSIPGSLSSGWGIFKGYFGY